jgi:hypothetical protein
MRDSPPRLILCSDRGGIVRQYAEVAIAHRRGTIVNADRIVVMDDGEVAETSTHDELWARRGRYFELVRSQVGLQAPPLAAEMAAADEPEHGTGAANSLRQYARASGWSARLGCRPAANGSVRISGTDESIPSP